MVATNHEPICYGRFGSPRLTQEWYETASRDAGLRARELRKAGYRVSVGAAGSQVTKVGYIKMTLVTIHGCPPWPTKVVDL